MNDFQMTFLANDRRHSLIVEAERERRARTTRKASPSREPQTRTRALGLGLLFGRVNLT